VHHPQASAYAATGAAQREQAPASFFATGWLLLCLGGRAPYTSGDRTGARQGELPLDATTGLDYDFMPSYETVGLSKDEWDSLNTPHENAVLPFKVRLHAPAKKPLRMAQADGLKDLMCNDQGGETTALARLKYYLWDSDLIADYFNIRNGMLGGDYSTKLSPWLAHGCISPLLIYEQIKKYERQRTENKSTYWVIFELIWYVASFSHCSRASSCRLINL
jgi:hypothetical protein